MRRHAAPGPPGFGYFYKPLGVRPLAKPKRDARGLLHGEIARRKRIGMAEAEQQINIGGPRPDAVQRGERGVRQGGLHIADKGEIDLSFGDGFADLADRLEIGSREAEPLELAGARAAHRVVMKRIEGGKQPGADRTGARGRELLSAYD